MSLTTRTILATLLILLFGFIFIAKGKLQANERFQYKHYTLEIEYHGELKGDHKTKYLYEVRQTVPSVVNLHKAESVGIEKSKVSIPIAVFMQDGAVSVFYIGLKKEKKKGFKAAWTDLKKLLKEGKAQTFSPVSASLNKGVKSYNINGFKVKFREVKE